MKRPVGLATLAVLVTVATSAGADPSPPSSPAPPESVGSVTSTNQSNGVVAGYVGTVQIAPPLVRGPQLEAFKTAFAAGAKALKVLKRGDLTDDQIDQLFDFTNQWASLTYNWLEHDVSDYAAERFMFQNALPMTWDLPGDHRAGEAQRRNNAINALTALLQNIDMLMRDPSIYPQK